jgi:signal peptidase I
MTSLDSDPMSVSDESQPAATRRPRWGLLATLLIAVAIVLLLRAFVGQIFVIPSGSMEPTLNPGNRVVVDKLGYGAAQMQRGDIVVFDGTGSFIAYSTPTPIERITEWFGVAHSKRYFVKRIIALPGDHLVCCTSEGKMLLNDKVLDESSILGKGASQSDIPFNVVVPAGHLWLMGDNRSNSADSRAHMGDPGGGFVPQSRVVGRVIAVIWPLNDIHTIKPGVPQ